MGARFFCKEKVTDPAGLTLARVWGEEPHDRVRKAEPQRIHNSKAISQQSTFTPS